MPSPVSCTTERGMRGFAFNDFRRGTMYDGYAPNYDSKLYLVMKFMTKGI